MPDSFIVYKIPFIKCKTDEIEIMDAAIIKPINNNIGGQDLSISKNAKNAKCIKNIIKLLVNVYWDYTINNSKYNYNEIDKISIGGICLEKIFNTVPEFGDSIIWIKYIKKIQHIFEESKEKSKEEIKETSKEKSKEEIKEKSKEKSKEEIKEESEDESENIHIGKIQEILINSINKINNNKKYDIYKNNDFSKNYKNIFNEISL
jgi:hypothetical protein